MRVALFPYANVTSTEVHYSKAHLEQVLAQAKVEVLPTAKAWDAYRAYDKRLTTGKDKGKLFSSL